MNQKVKAGYNQAAEKYSSVFRDQFKNEKHLEWLTTSLKPGAKVLDVGCGAGKPIDEYLVKQGIKVTGIDISEAQIELAKKNVPEAAYEVKDMSQLRANEFEVDAVVSFYALFHIPREEHGQIIKKFHSFLKKGGYLLITLGVNNWEGCEEFCGVTMYWSHYGKEQNLELVKESGFKILRAEVDTSGGEEHLVVFAEAT
jgi:cyclopropane fatty-acyl-phospholipid synthase-like methyltransferase